MIESLFLYILYFVFISINTYIIYIDIYYKRIPNKSLIILLVLSIIFHIFFGDFSVLFFGWILGNIIVSFMLFYFGIWSAGDAKYGIVLSSFLFSGSVFSFIGNIGFLTIIYLFLYTLYIYIIKSLFDYRYAKDLGKNIFSDIQGKINSFLESNNTKTFNFKVIILSLLPLIFGFLVLFTFIRLLRIYIINSILNQTGESSGGRIEFILAYIQEYTVYIVVGLIIVLYIIYRGLRSYLKIAYKASCEKLNISENSGKYILLFISSLLLLIFIIYEYIKDKDLIIESLIRIFTFYIFIWLFIKFLRYLHYVTFQLGEVIYKPIKKLSPGDIVDKAFLIQLFGTQKILGYECEGKKYSPDPKGYLENIENPIDKKTLFEIKNMYKIVNNYHKKQKTPGFQEITAIKVLKTFAFGPYIFFGFLITYFYGNTPLNTITRFILENILKINL